MTPDQDTMKQNDSRFCAHCGTKNPKELYSCDRCGERIYLPDPNAPPALGLVECQQCVTANEARASYCVKCGSSLANAAHISVLGGGESARRAPHSDLGGIRVSPRGRDPAVRRRSKPEPRLPDSRPEPVPKESAPPSTPTDRARQPKIEQQQRGAARAKVDEQEREKPEASADENTSGTRSARLPQSARGWNTAAFLIGPVWGPVNGVWLGVVGLTVLVIPESVLTLGLRITLYLAYGVFLGFRGNEMAWRARRWVSLEQFQKVQQQWMLLALVVNLVMLFMIPILLRR
jgi:hypothetical protein